MGFATAGLCLAPLRQWQLRNRDYWRGRKLGPFRMRTGPHAALEQF
jgi:hypothetical protein